MSSIVPMLVPGATADGTILVTAPWDGAPIAEVETGGADAVERALATAASAGEPLPIPERVAILERTAALMRDRREDLAVEAAREGGKPLVDSLVEVDRAIDGVHLCVETIRTQAGVEIPMRINAASMNRMAYTHYEPIGPVVAFSAFNHPLNLIVHQVAPAVATGCPVIVKPAAATPISCMRFVEMLQESGLPPTWCQALVTTGHDVAGALASDPRVRLFMFIGSGRVGWRLRSQLAPGTRCVLEHGGAAPVIMETDADLDDAVPLLAKGGMYHAGQVCVSVQRVFAARAIAGELADRLAVAADAMKVGDPTSPDTDVGPLIREEEVLRVGAWVKEAGGRIVTGGEDLGARAYRPTIVLDPSPDAKLSREEVFGPVIAVYSTESLDEGIRRANDVPFSFQASVFGKNIDGILYATRHLEAAAVMVNDHTAFRVDWMPFAGHKTSGHGIGGIPYTMHDMQNEKLVVIRSKAL